MGVHSNSRGGRERRAPTQSRWQTPESGKTSRGTVDGCAQQQQEGEGASGDDAVQMAERPSEQPETVPSHGRPKIERDIAAACCPKHSPNYCRRASNATTLFCMSEMRALN